MKLSCGLVFSFCCFTLVLSAPFKASTASCSSQIYCQGDLLHDVQMSRIYSDSKTFVDKRMKTAPSEIIDKYASLKAKYPGETPPKEEIMKFIDEHFEDGNELEPVALVDWVAQPTVLAKIKDPKYREWASELNELWKNLSRKVTDEVKENQDRYSLIYVPNSFVIPGGRFKELYYWDTYWIINGLLQCDMISTVKGVIENLLSLVKLMGHIPNGSRVYYELRSQPPLLTFMMNSYLQKSKDMKFLHDNIDILDQELEYWLKNRMIEVPFEGKTYSMFRYFAESPGPRPESYREDVLTVSNKKTDEEKNAMYTALKSAAESGWDFSTRWFIKNGTNKGNLSDIATPSIIPVDLNSMLQKDFDLMSEWYRQIGEKQKSEKYEALSKDLVEAINTVLWNDEDGIWYDYDIQNNKPRNYFYLSNFTPLWTGSYSCNGKGTSEKILRYVKENKLESYIGGTPTSMENSGEQWDFPNAWAPLQAFVIQGLDRMKTNETSEVAFTLASKWIHSNYEGFQSFNKMFEKYDSLLVGQTGSGGEYNAQFGFGWTNGVVFEFLSQWGPRLEYYPDKVRAPAS